MSMSMQGEAAARNVDRLTFAFIATFSTLEALGRALLVLSTCNGAHASWQQAETQ